MVLPLVVANFLLMILETLSHTACDKSQERKEYEA